MNELVTVGGVCFVTANLNGLDGLDGDAETEVTGGAANGKRKYRARGERSRKEQRHAAWVKWYAKHQAERIAKSKEQRISDPERYRAYQRKWREERRRKRLHGVTS